MMRLGLVVSCVIGLAGCGGGGEYQSYMRERALQGEGAAAPAPAEPGQRAALSDEQNFEAVSARETIESDRARIEELREQYVFIAPQPLPERRETGPNIVAYALEAPGRVGEARYRRLNPLRGQMAQGACARFASPDLAQQAFLAAGGPERDPRNLDPDGDGFACGWDPAPFRAAVN